VQTGDSASDLRFCFGRVRSRPILDCCSTRFRLAESICLYVLMMVSPWSNKRKGGKNSKICRERNSRLSGLANRVNAWWNKVELTELL
jgi:hypothetical protein